MSKSISAYYCRTRIQDAADERKVWVNVFGYSDFESLYIFANFRITVGVLLKT